MGCNCKKTFDKMKPYGEGYIKDENIKENIFFRIFKFINQLFFGVIAGAIFIVIAIPLIIYIVICLMLGKTPSIRIKRFNKVKLNG